MLSSHTEANNESLGATWKKLKRGGYGIEVIEGRKSTGEHVRDLEGTVVVVKARSGRESHVRLGRRLWADAATPWNPAKAVYLPASRQNNAD